MAAFITLQDGTEYTHHVDKSFTIDKEKIKEIQADGHELDHIRSHYPSFVGKARVQTFYGDLARLVSNSFVQ